MKTKYLNLAIAFIVIIAMSACKKDQSNPQDSKTETSANILAFKNMEEYHQAVKEVHLYTYSERKAWEASKGFKSFGTACEDFYYEIKPDAFKSKDEIVAFVSKNSDFLEIINEDGGDFTVQTKLSNSINRYFVNSEKIFQIGKSYIKVLNNALVSCQASFFNELKQISDVNLDKYESNQNFKVSRTLQSLNLKSTTDEIYNCGYGTSNTKTNGNDRTTITIGLNEFNPSGFPFTELNCTYQVKPQHKSIGWWGCTRHISSNVKVRIDRYNWGLTGWINEIKTDVVTDQYATSIDKEIFYMLESMNGMPVPYTTHPAHFGGYDAWGSTPSAGPALVQCNTFLVN